MYTPTFSEMTTLTFLGAQGNWQHIGDWRLDIQNILFQQNRPAFLPHIQIFDFGNQKDIQIAIPWTHISAY